MTAVTSEIRFELLVHPSVKLKDASRETKRVSVLELLRVMV